MSDQEWNVTRRQMCAAVGAAVMSGVSGCGSNPEAKNSSQSFPDEEYRDDAVKEAGSLGRIRRAPATLGIVFPNYRKDKQNQPGPDALTYTLGSFVRFSQQLERIGHSVSLITELGSKQELQRLDSKWDEKRTHFIETDDSDAKTLVLRHVEQWCNENFKSGSEIAPYGFICLAGHGETRVAADGVTDHYLLTSTNGRGVGGVSVRELEKEVAQLRLPIVFIIDTCRHLSIRHLVVERSFVMPNWREKGGGEIDPIRGQANTRSKGGYPTVTKIFASHPLKSTVEMKERDLMSMLTEGMMRGTNQKMFLARERREQYLKNRSDHGIPLELNSELSLYTLFWDAAVTAIEWHEGSHVPQLERGYTDASMIIASTDDIDMHKHPPLNLVKDWREFVDGMSLHATSIDSGIQFSRPSPREDNFLFNAAFLSQSFPWKDYKFVIDVVAHYDRAEPDEELVFLIMPGNNHKFGHYVSKDWYKPRLAPYGKVKRFEIGLNEAFAQKAESKSDDDPKFTSVAISLVPGRLKEWPSGATLTVIRMVLMNSKTNEPYPVPFATPGDVNLVSAVHWRKSSNRDLAHHEVGTDQTNHKRWLVFEASSSGSEIDQEWVGRITTTKYIEKGQQQLSLQCSGEVIRDECELTVEVFEEHKRLVRIEINDLVGTASEEPREFSIDRREFSVDENGFATNVRVSCRGIRLAKFSEFAIVDS